MLGLAAGYVPSQAAAEEAVQDTWVAVLHGVSRFEGRSSVRTWLFRILANRARSAGERERRATAVPAPAAAVDPARSDPSGSWSLPPEHWVDLAETGSSRKRWPPACEKPLTQFRRVEHHEAGAEPEQDLGRPGGAQPELHSDMTGVVDLCGRLRQIAFVQQQNRPRISRPTRTVTGTGPRSSRSPRRDPLRCRRVLPRRGARQRTPTA
jgi:hypothetical protein